MAGPPMLPQVLMQDVRGLSEGGVDVAKRNLVGRDLVGGKFAADRRRTPLIGRPAIGGCRQQIVIDCDQSHGVLGDIAVSSEYNRNWFAHERHFATGQREGPTVVEPRAGIRGAHHAPLLEHRREVVERENSDHAWQCACGACINTANERVRMRTAHERGVQRAGRGEVVDEMGAAGQQRMILYPRDACAD